MFKFSKKVFSRALEKTDAIELISSKRMLRENRPFLVHPLYQ